MVSMGFKVLVGVAVLVGFAAFYARPRFPESASNHRLKTFVSIYFKVVGFVSAASGFIGFSPLNTTRNIMTFMTTTDKQSSEVERSTVMMDGVEVVVFKPVGETSELRAGILHIHGGGWVLFSPDSYAPICEEIVKQTGSVLVSVNYRLAPEHPYPIPLEDCLTATRYFLLNAEDFGVDENLIGIKGDSAGGNLAMAVALKLSKEADLPSLKFMSLDYPALQAFDFELPCYQKYEHGPGLLTKKSMLSYWLLYAFGDLNYYDMFYDNKHVTTNQRESLYGDFIKTDLLPNSILDTASKNTKKKTVVTDVQEKITEIIMDPLYAPLMASDEDLSLLPPAYVLIVEFDVLRDDGFIVTERLRRAGVEVTTSFLATEEHGYLSLVSMDPTIADEVARFAKFQNTTLKL